MKIAVGGIIHPRETVPCYLNHIAALQEPLDCKVEHIWVLDGQGEGPQLGDQILERCPTATVIAEGSKLPGKPYRREERGKRAAYERLAHLRNCLKAAVLARECDALISVDSDIMVPQELLCELRDAEKPWVAALVRNHGICMQHLTSPSTTVVDRYWNVMYIHEPAPGKPLYEHFKTVGLSPQDETWPTEPTDRPPHPPKPTMTKPRLTAGAVCWYSRELLERVSFAGWEGTQNDPMGLQCGGEDIAFGIRALEAGHSAWYIPLICEHLMFPKQLERHRESCPTCVSMT